MDQVTKDQVALALRAAASCLLTASGSVVTKPVFHGTGATFSRFSLAKSTMGIIWFTSDRASIESGDAGAQGSGQILTLKVDLRNPAGWDEYNQLGLGELRRDGFDGALLRERDGTFTGFVFDPKQIKIIGRDKLSPTS